MTDAQLDGYIHTGRPSLQKLGADDKKAISKAVRVALLEQRPSLCQAIHERVVRSNRGFGVGYSALMAAIADVVDGVIARLPGPDDDRPRPLKAA